MSYISIRDTEVGVRHSQELVRSCFPVFMVSSSSRLATGNLFVQGGPGADISPQHNQNLITRNGHHSFSMCDVRELTFLPLCYFSSFTEKITDVPRRGALGNIPVFFTKRTLTSWTSKVQQLPSPLWPLPSSLGRLSKASLPPLTISASAAWSVHLLASYPGVKQHFLALEETELYNYIIF